MAVAITLLVLNLEVPVLVTRRGRAWQSLRDLLDDFAASSVVRAGRPFWLLTTGSSSAYARSTSG